MTIREYHVQFAATLRLGLLLTMVVASELVLFVAAFAAGINWPLLALAVIATVWNVHQLRQLTFVEWRIAHLNHYHVVRRS